MVWWLSIILAGAIARADEMQALIEALQVNVQQLQQQLDEVSRETADDGDEGAAAAQAALEARLASEQLARSVHESLATDKLQQELLAMQAVAPLSDDDRQDVLRVLRGRLARRDDGSGGDQDDAKVLLKRLQDHLGNER